MVGYANSEKTIVPDGVSVGKHIAAFGDADTRRTVVLNRFLNRSRLTTLKHHEAPARMVLKGVTGKLGLRPIDDDALAHRALHRVSTKPAKAVTNACDAAPAAIDGEPLYCDPLRINNVDHKVIPTRSIDDRCSQIGDQGESIKALNYNILVASTGHRHSIWPDGVKPLKCGSDCA